MRRAVRASAPLTHFHGSATAFPAQADGRPIRLHVVCTLICAFRVFPRWPLIVAANRDEHLNRPASPPRLWPGDLSFVAPRDEAAGGTWLGLNSAGLFVGVTNRFGVP